MTEAEAYKLLGLSPAADEQQIKRAYRQALRTAHPDAGGTDREFIAVRTAYHTLLRARAATPARAADASRPTTRQQATVRKHRSTTAKAQLQVVGSKLRTHQYDPFSFGQTYQPGFFGSFSAGRKQHAQAEKFAATVLAHRVPRALPAARLLNGVKLSGQPRIPQLLISGYRAVLFFPLLVPDGRYRFTGEQLASERGPIPTPQVGQIRRALETRFSQLNTIAKIVPLTLAMDSQRPIVTAESSPAGGHELVSAANLSTAVADAVLFLAAGPQPHVLDTDLLAALIDVE